MKLALIHANIINGKDTYILENATVLINEQIIEQVGKEKEVSIPRDYETLDVSGMFVMPGLIESHGHLCANTEAIHGTVAETPLTEMGIKAVRYGQDTLMAGYTSFRSGSDHGYLDVALRNMVARGIVEGPRVFACGHFISRTGGRADYHNEWTAIPLEHRFSDIADGVDEVRKAVRRQIKAGVDFIQFCATGGIMTSVGPEVQEYSNEEMQTIIEEAHRARKLVTAHAEGIKGAKAAVMAGVDCIEHGLSLDDETVKIMKDRNVYLVPTLASIKNIVEHGTEAGISQAECNQIKDVRIRQLKSFKMALAAGIKMGAGLEAGGAPRCLHGENAQELQAMVEAGMTPMEAIISATRNASEIVGFSDKIGTIEAGKLADLIAVNGNPVEDISTLRNKQKILMILKEGKVIKNNSES